MRNLAFGAPQYLWLLSAPAALLGLWIVRFVQRRAGLRR